MEFLESVFNANEYWPTNVKIKFDKNFWYYSLWVRPTDKEIKKGANYRHYTKDYNEEDFLKLDDKGFMIVHCQVDYIHKEQLSGNFSTIGLWGTDDQKFGSLVSQLFLQIVRIDEFDKYKQKNWRYRNPY